MPRRDSPVKNKYLITPGAVDIHFHGAFGIDLMRASRPEFEELAQQLWKHGIAAFCPTTLSTSAPELRASVSRIGAWLRSRRSFGAIPLGIHLEGPFISGGACGAHPPGLIRRLSFNELESLWEASQQTLKILTIAPEELKDSELKRLCQWARKRKVVLSLGHSQATQEQASHAFDSGFAGVTHAWNALNFHHRTPGVLGSAVGRKDVYLELILDGIHVSQTVLRWTQQLHDPKHICFVSDCVPAAGTKTGWYPFGPLRIRFEKGACRLANGALAGGGVLLPEAYARWLTTEARARSVDLNTLLRKSVESLTRAPLRALGIPPALLKRHRIRWKVTGNTVKPEPITVD